MNGLMGEREKGIPDLGCHTEKVQSMYPEGPEYAGKGGL